MKRLGYFKAVEFFEEHLNEFKNTIIETELKYYDEDEMDDVVARLTAGNMEDGNGEQCSKKDVEDYLYTKMCDGYREFFNCVHQFLSKHKVKPESSRENEEISHRFKDVYDNFCKDVVIPQLVSAL